MSNIDVVRKNLGHVTAYKYAVSKGFQGTEEEFAELMASYASIAQDVSAESRVAEGYALGKQNGVDVGDQSPYYHANAKYHAEQAAASASAAAESARTLTIDPTLTHSGQAADAKAAGDEISDLKKYLMSEDTFVNDNLSYVNYGYDTPYYREIDDGSSTWDKKTGIKRNGQVVVLNRNASYSSIIRIKVSGNIDQAASNSMVDAWSDGITLITGHEYVATIKLLSGISYTTDSSQVYIPHITVYRAGEHTGWSVAERIGNIAKTTFTAEANTKYNLCIQLQPGDWTMTNAKFLITLLDMTTSRIDKVETDLSGVLTRMPYMFDGRYNVHRIPDNTDYDTLTTPGTYRVDTMANARTMINCPTKVSHKLFVFQTSSATKIYQIIFHDGFTSTIYYRHKRLDNEAFRPWHGINATDMSNVLVDGLPGYYFDNDYLTNRVKTIIDNAENIGMHSDSLIFFTDPHTYRDGDPNETQNGLQGIALINYIVNRTNIKQIVCGGDLTNGNTMTPEQQLTLLKHTRSFYSPIWNDLYMIIGNHEWNNPALDEDQNQNMLTINQLYPLLLKDKEREYGALEPVAGCYWVDNLTQKIRYFYLSCTPGGNIDRYSLIWFAEEMEKIPDGYTVFILSHIGLLTDPVTGDPIYCGKFEEIVNILEAAKAGTTYSYTWPGTSNPITGDYSNLTNVTIAGAISGHKHLDISMYSTSGIPIIGTTCDRGPKSDSTDLFKKARAYGTIGEQAIDVVQIDVTNRSIYVTRIGGCITGASYDSETGLIYDTEVGTGTEYTGTEWTLYCPYKDRVFTF